MATELQRLAKQVAQRLDRRANGLVLAESCTGGLVAATLAQIPGISRNLCGSLVTYQDETKKIWLQIPETLLDRPGPVSEVVAGWMAERALAHTPRADLAASVTGHLGPQAPKRLDGVVFVAVSVRLGTAQQIITSVTRNRLRNATRIGRQQEAARLVLRALRDALEPIAP